MGVELMLSCLVIAFVCGGVVGYVVGRAGDIVSGAGEWDK